MLVTPHIIKLLSTSPIIQINHHHGKPPQHIFCVAFFFWYGVVLDRTSVFQPASSDLICNLHRFLSCATSYTSALFTPILSKSFSINVLFPTCKLSSSSFVLLHYANIVEDIRAWIESISSKLHYPGFSILLSTWKTYRCRWESSQIRIIPQPKWQKFWFFESPPHFKPAFLIGLAPVSRYLLLLLFQPHILLWNSV